MTFYSEGFFGYGDPGNYIPYGLDYFIPILILIGCSVLVILKRRQIRIWPGEGRLRFILGFIIIIVEMSYFWRLLYVGLDNSGDTSLLTRLPIQLCEWGAICSAFMVMSLNDTLFGINYFITFIGAGIALLVPQTVISSCGPAYYRYYQFWLEHALPIFVTVYVMAVHGKRPRYRDLWISFGCLCLLGIPATIANMTIPEADYLYFKMSIPFIPESYPVRAVIYAILILTAFHVLYFAWVLFERIYQKKRKT